MTKVNVIKYLDFIYDRYYRTFNFNKQLLTKKKPIRDSNNYYYWRLLLLNVASNKHMNKTAICKRDKELLGSVLLMFMLI